MSMEMPWLLAMNGQDLLEALDAVLLDASHGWGRVWWVFLGVITSLGILVVAVHEAFWLRRSCGHISWSWVMSFEGGSSFS